MTSSVIWRANDCVHGPLGRLLGEGEARSCRRTDVWGLPSTRSAATARTRASAGSSQRGGRGPLHPTLDSVSAACSFPGRSDRPNSFRPSPTGRGRNTWSWSSFPFCIKRQTNFKSRKVSTRSRIIPVGDGAENALHHGQMFPIIVGLKEGHAQVKFKEDAANRPDIARLRPAQFYSSSSNQWQSLIITTCLMSCGTRHHCVLPRMTSGAR